VTAPGVAAAGGGGYVTNEVIALQLKHLGDTIDVLRTHIVTELQLLRQESVRRDVYDEQRARDRSELDDMKKRLETAEQRKWMMWVAVATAVFALGKDLLAGVMQ
jgi:hypothetical protein